jgi:hypothetical protein
LDRRVVTQAILTRWTKTVGSSEPFRKQNKITRTGNKLRYARFSRRSNVARLTVTSIDIHIAGILCYEKTPDIKEALKDARHYVKLGHTVNLQPYHFGTKLTTMTYVPSTLSHKGYIIVKGIIHD